MVPIEEKYRLLKVETEDKTYYLRINSVNVLYQLREDSNDGNVISQIIY